MLFSSVYATYALGMTVAAVVSYLFGSINFAIIFTNLFMHGEDIRNHGSGNAGMTNVLRTAGKLPALLTLIGDLTKSAIAACFSYWLFMLIGLDGHGDIGMLVGAAAAFTGHLLPVYYGFRGGKGVLATAGVFLVIDWRVAAIGLTVFLIMLAITKIISVSSIVGEITIPILTFIFCVVDGLCLDAAFFLKMAVALYISVFVIIKHRDNIKRLCAGTEPKVGQKLKK